MTDFLIDGPDPMPQPVMKAGPMEFGLWRNKWPDIRINKSGEDGDKDAWMGLLSTHGATKLDNAILKVRAGKRDGSKIYFNDALEALTVIPSHNSASDPKQDEAVSKACRRDLLIWCITHNPACYADAICSYREMEGVVSERTFHVCGRPITLRFEGRVRVEPESRWEQLRGWAEDARKELSVQTGVPLEQKYKTKLYEDVKKSHRLIAWLRTRRLVP
jgi:hypothetical protein